jgi:hypothetical protein
MLSRMASCASGQLRDDKDAVQVGSARGALARWIRCPDTCGLPDVRAGVALALGDSAHQSHAGTAAGRVGCEYVLAFMAVGMASGDIEYGEATPVSLWRVRVRQRGTAGPASLFSARGHAQRPVGQAQPQRQP